MKIYRLAEETDTDPFAEENHTDPPSDEDYADLVKEQLRTAIRQHH